jgi:hypothetical protein
VLKRWLADLFDPRRAKSDERGWEVRADDLAPKEFQVEPSTTETALEEQKVERQDWLKWMRSLGLHDRLVEAGFRCESRRYVLRANDKLLVFWRNAGIQGGGRSNGFFLALTFDWLLPLTQNPPLNNRHGFPKYPEHFPMSISVAELKVQRKRYGSPARFRYHLSWDARECYPTRNDSEHDFPLGGYDEPFEHNLPLAVDIALSDGLWFLESITPSMCLEILSRINYDRRVYWDKRFEDAIRERLNAAPETHN